MIAAILAGGMGTRMQEITTVIPKPMVEIGHRPILWHIMKSYRTAGVREFAVALGYRGQVIKQFFLDQARLAGDLRVDLANGAVTGNRPEEDWIVNLLETGAKAQTGARLARMKALLGKEPFFLTYGDGISNVDHEALLAFHRRTGRIATLTAVRPPARFGALHLSGDMVDRFSEKPLEGEDWVNGGFFVCEPGIFDYVTDDDDCVLEREPLERLARDGQLAAFHHEGFWHSMDTARDVQTLNGIWANGDAAWKLWKD